MPIVMQISGLMFALVGLSLIGYGISLADGYWSILGLWIGLAGLQLSEQSSAALWSYSAAVFFATSTCLLEFGLDWEPLFHRTALVVALGVCLAVLRVYSRFPSIDGNVTPFAGPFGIIALGILLAMAGVLGLMAVSAEQSA